MTHAVFVTCNNMHVHVTVPAWLPFAADGGQSAHWERG